MTDCFVLLLCLKKRVDSAKWSCFEKSSSMQFDDLQNWFLEKQMFYSIFTNCVNSYSNRQQKCSNIREFTMKTYWPTFQIWNKIMCTIGCQIPSTKAKLHARHPLSKCKTPNFLQISNNHDFSSTTLICSIKLKMWHFWSYTFWTKIDFTACILL